jgi:hypothetical protein
MLRLAVISMPLLAVWALAALFRSVVDLSLLVANTCFQVMIVVSVLTTFISAFMFIAVPRLALRTSAGLCRSVVDLSLLVANTCF